MEEFDNGLVCYFVLIQAKYDKISQLETFANSLLKVFSKFLRILSAWSKFVSSAKIKKNSEYLKSCIYHLFRLRRAKDPGRSTVARRIMFPVFSDMQFLILVV